MGLLSEKIEHIVVLMQENRSFDSMLGMLYPKSSSFNGLSGQETNPLEGKPNVPVWCTNDTSHASMSIPKLDPGETWDDMNVQLFGVHGTPGDQPPSMDGFVANDEIQAALDQPLNDFQVFLHDVAAHLPSTPQTNNKEGLIKSIEKHL